MHIQHSLGSKRFYGGKAARFNLSREIRGSSGNYAIKNVKLETEFGKHIQHLL
jgi:hypothetical protein